MKRFIFKTLFKILLLSQLCVLQSYAWELQQLEKLTDSNVVSLKSSGIYTDGCQNYMTFLVDVQQQNEYYVAAWLHSVKYENSGYGTYQFLVNDNNVGCLIPSSEGWQSVSLQKNEKITLNDGVNVISVACNAPEIPSVEFIKLSRQSKNVGIDDTRYKEYLTDVLNNNNSKTSNICKTEQAIPQSTSLYEGITLQ